MSASKAESRRFDSCHPCKIRSTGSRGIVPNDVPNPIPVDYMYTDFTPPEKAYFGNKSVSSEPIYWLYADLWRLHGRPYHFEIEWTVS